MDIPTLSVEPRSPGGTRAAARLRRAGKLPAIVYGHGRPPAAVALNYHDFEQTIEHGHHLVNLNLEGRVQPCLMKDVQYDYLGATIVHADLARVDLSEMVTVTVVLELRGTPQGVKDGGVLTQELMDVELECRASDIPESVRFDVSHLKLDDVLYARDLNLGELFRVISDPESVVATVREPHVGAPEVVAEPTEGEAAAAEPEVIGKGKEESEESGGES